MSSLRTRVFLTVLALTFCCARGHACNWEEEDAVKFCLSSYAALDERNPYCLTYEIIRTGIHTADVHFKNYTKAEVNIEFWIPSFQSPGENAALRVPPNYPGDKEAIAHLKLKAAGPGLIFSTVNVQYARTLTQQQSPEPSAHPTAIADEAWFGVVPDMEMAAFGRESAVYRIFQRGSDSFVTFRNTSRQPEFFDFEVPGYALAPHAKNARVKLGVGAERTVPVLIAHPDAMLPLACVRVSNIRVDHDSGACLDMKELENGWFAIVSVDMPAVNPNLIVYRIDDVGGANTNIRFKNLSGRAVTFMFGVGKQRIEHAVRVTPDSETIVPVNLPGDSILRALARVRVTDLAFDVPPPTAPTH